MTKKPTTKKITPPAASVEPEATGVEVKSIVIGLDPGFGNTKVSVDGQYATIQSAVSRPRDIGMAAIGFRSAGRDVPIVTIDGVKFAVGPGSWNKGEPLTSMDYSALTSRERTALFYAALSKVLSVQTANTHLDATLVVGLPVPLMQDPTQAQAVMEALKGYKREHTFTVTRGEATTAYAFTVTRLKVLAQPVGAYMDWLYDETLQARIGGAKAEVAVLDIGMNTLDLYVIQSGQVIDRHVGGAEVGVRRLLEIVTTNGHDIVEMDAQLRNHTLTPDAAALETWLGEILAAVKKTWPQLRRFSTVIPTGGGALVLGDKLTMALVARGATLHKPVDPVAANVNGFCKYGRK